MHLKYTFETMELDDRIVAVPLNENMDEYRGIVKLNETAAFIFNLLREDVTEDDLVNALENVYDAPREVLLSDIKKYLHEFQEKGLVVQ
jgi:hypothetical protein